MSNNVPGEGTDISLVPGNMFDASILDLEIEAVEAAKVADRLYRELSRHAAELSYENFPKNRTPLEATVSYFFADHGNGRPVWTHKGPTSERLRISGEFMGFTVLKEESVDQIIQWRRDEVTGLLPVLFPMICAKLERPSYAEEGPEVTFPQSMAARWGYVPLREIA